MLLSRLADTWAALAATRSRNAKRDLIAGVLGEAEAGEIEIVVAYLSVCDNGGRAWGGSRCRRCQTRLWCRP